MNIQPSHQSPVQIKAAFFVLFNLHAVITIAVVVVVVFLLQLTILSESFAVSLYFDLLLAFIIMVVGGAMEMAGVRGRIFFMPVWLIGLGYMSYFLYVLLGWQGIIIAIAILGAGFWLLVEQGKKIEMRKWEKAPDALFRARKLFERGDYHSSEFWSFIEKALFIPALDNYSRDMCRHNAEVSALLLTILPRNSELYQQVLELKQEWLRGMRNTESEYYEISEKKIRDISEFISQQLRV